MNIVYVMSMSSTSATSGVAKQALIWAEELRRQGHTVELYSPWSPPDWKAVDVAHFFGNGIWLAITMQTFRGAGVKRIVASPIIDSLKSPFIYKLASFMGCGRLRLFSSNYALRYVKPWVSAALVRSFYEERFLRESYGYSADKVKLLRLPARNVVERQEFNAEDKEPFCFHCSLFTQDRKNVMRLMQAAVKYNFKLVIAGAPGTEAATQPYLDMAAAHPDNIQILGRISDEQLADCYRRAKVFALPSIMEGVGFVALEAAAFGCNIVITNIGGPKEYYDGMAHEVNPFSVDEIGRAVVAAMQEPTTDKLANHIAANYSLSANVRDLADIYATIPSMP